MRLRFCLIALILAVSAYGQTQTQTQTPTSPTMSGSLPNQQQQSGDIRPIPDPTVLTMQALERAISTLKELTQTRLSAMDEATRILQARADKVPNEVDVKVLHLQALHDEKFKSIDKQFDERDTRTDQLAAASQLAIKDALQAAKESVVNQNISNDKAIAKSESNTTKLLDLLSLQIADVKERLGAVENKGVGQTIERSSQQTDNSYMIAVAAVIVTVILGIAGLAFTFTRRQQ